MNLANSTLNESFRLGESEKYFWRVFENGPLKTIMILCSAILSVTNLALTFGIIWYERFHSDSRRTLMNRLVSSVCFQMIKWILLCQTSNIVRYIFGPLPLFVCSFQAILQFAIHFEVLFLFDWMQITKYIFIIKLKNPSAITEEFWSLFINLWTYLVCNLFSASVFLIENQQLISYYTCSDTYMSHDPNFPRTDYSYIDTISLLVFIAIQIRLYVFNSKNVATQQEVTNANSGRASLGNIYSNILSIACLCGLAVLSRIVNSLNSSTVNQFPNYIYLQFTQLIAPNIVVLLLSIVYYIQYPKMINFIYQTLHDICTK